MKDIIFTHGTNVRDFFIVPTIKYNHDGYGYCKYLTLEWLNFYVGFKWE